MADRVDAESREEWRGAWEEHAEKRTRVHRLLLLALDYHLRGQDVECHPSHQRLANVTGLHRNSVRKYLGQLEASGWIETRKVPRQAGGTRNAYHLTIPTAHAHAHGDVHETDPHAHAHEDVHETSGGGSRAQDRPVSSTRSGISSTDPTDLVHKPMEMCQKQEANTLETEACQPRALDLVEWMQSRGMAHLVDAFAGLENPAVATAVVAAALDSEPGGAVVARALTDFLEKSKSRTLTTSGFARWMATAREIQDASAPKTPTRAPSGGYRPVITERPGPTRVTETLREFARKHDFEIDDDEAA